MIHSHQPYSHAWPKKSHIVCRDKELWKSRAVMETVGCLDTAGWDFRQRRVKWQGDYHTLSTLFLQWLGFWTPNVQTAPRDLEDEVGRRSRRGREGWGACVWSDKLPWHSPEPWMRHCLCSWKPELPWCVMYRTGFSTLPAGPVGHVGCVETILDSSRWLTSDRRRRPDTALGLRQLGSSAVSGTRR